MSNVDPYNSSDAEARAENGPTQPEITAITGQTLNESERAANLDGSLLDADKVEAPFEGDKLNQSEVDAGIDGSLIEDTKVEESFTDRPVVSESEVKAGLTDKSVKTNENGVPEGTIDEVLAWVGDDEEKAQLALDAETAGKNRTSLVNKLKAIG